MGRGHLLRRLEMRDVVARGHGLAAVMTSPAGRLKNAQAPPAMFRAVGSIANPLLTSAVAASAYELVAAGERAELEHAPHRQRPRDRKSWHILTLVNVWKTEQRASPGRVGFRAPAARATEGMKCRLSRAPVCDDAETPVAPREATRALRCLDEHCRGPRSAPIHLGTARLWKIPSAGRVLLGEAGAIGSEPPTAAGTTRKKLRPRVASSHGRA